MRIQHQPAFVLRLQPYSESSQLVTLFTRDHGRLMVMAKGARRLKSPQRGYLIAFLPLRVSWSGKGDLPVLTQVESTGVGRYKLSGDDFFCGFYLHELLIKLLHAHDPHARLFEVYENCLQRLASAGEDSQLALRLFEKYLLQEIGYGLVLDRDVDNGEALKSTRRYRYVVNHGPIAMDDRQQSVEEGVDGQTLQALSRDSLVTQKQFAQCKLLLRRVLAVYLDGRKLHSRSMLRQMQAHKTHLAGRMAKS